MILIPRHAKCSQPVLSAEWITDSMSFSSWENAWDRSNQSETFFWTWEPRKPVFLGNFHWEFAWFVLFYGRWMMSLDNFGHSNGRCNMGGTKGKQRGLKFLPCFRYVISCSSQCGWHHSLCADGVRQRDTGDNQRSCAQLQQGGTVPRTPSALPARHGEVLYS